MNPEISKEINERTEKLKNASDLQPTEISLIIVELSALWANLNKALVDADCNYRERRKLEREKYKTSAEAAIFSEASPEYRQFREAEMRSKSLQEIIRSGKKHIAMVESELREGR